MYDLWWSCSPSHPCSTTLWAPDHSMIMRLRKDKRHWRAPAKARSCPRQGGIEPPHTLTTLGLKSSPNPTWNDRRPVAGEGVLANMRRCTSDLRTARWKFLSQRSRVPRQTASFKGLALGGVVGFNGKWLLPRGWVPKERVLACVLWRGARYRGWERHRSKIPTAAY